MSTKVRAVVGAIASLAVIYAGPGLADEVADGMAAVQQGNYASAVNFFIAAAEQGNALIQAQLGSMYYDGIGVPVDHTKAIYWNNKAAAAGRPDAAFRMGLAYDDARNTYGIPQNATLAQSWFRKAWNLAQPLLAKEDLTAEYTVGNELAFGFGRVRDRERGLVYLRKSADAGNLDALFQVGELTVAQDKPTGKALLERAAADGHSYAMYVLALMYLHDNDLGNAKIWLERSVAYRNPQASQKLLDVFHIQTTVPGLGKLPEQPPELSHTLPSNDPVTLFTSVLALSVAVALLTQHTAPGLSDQDRAAQAGDMQQRMTQNSLRAIQCATYFKYHNGIPTAVRPCGY